MYALTSVPYANVSLTFTLSEPEVDDVSRATWPR
jgi:hypothetical protein